MSDGTVTGPNVITLTQGHSAGVTFEVGKVQRSNVLILFVRDVKGTIRNVWLTPDEARRLAAALTEGATP